MELPSHSNSMFNFLRKGDLTLGPALPYNPGGWPPSAKSGARALVPKEQFAKGYI